MRWLTHQTGAILGSAAIGLPLAGLFAAGIGAIIPDLVDQRVSAVLGGKRGRQKLFNQIHRGASHWFGWWLAIFLGSLALPMPELLQHACHGFGFGALSHVIMDMLTPAGIPLHPFSRRGKLALPVCATGKASEYVFLFAILCAAACYWHELTVAVIENLR